MTSQHATSLKVAKSLKIGLAHLFRIIYFVPVFFLSYCGEDKEQKTCLPPPCGEISIEATNLTILSQDDISNVIVSVGGVDTSIALKGMDISQSQFFSCWQAIPDLSNETSISLKYNLNEVLVTGDVSTSSVSGNILVLEINGSNVTLSDYSRCSDTEDSL